MNIPYVKEYNTNGQVVNAITKDTPYLSTSQNRRDKKSANKFRFHNNRNTFPMTVIGADKYYKVLQWIGSKRIEHYIKSQYESYILFLIRLRQTKS